MSVDRIDPIVPRPGTEGLPVACYACLPRNVALQVGGMHHVPGGLYLHLVCSNGHHQRLGLRASGGRVLLEVSVSTPAAARRPNEVVH